MTAHDRRRIIRWRNLGLRYGWFLLAGLWSAALWGVVLIKIRS